jgi:DNA-binding response OmpR family regulator
MAGLDRVGVFNGRFNHPGKLQQSRKNAYIRIGGLLDNGLTVFVLISLRLMTYKILVADGSPSLQKLLQISFAASDFEIFAIGDGQEFMDSLGQIDPDAILLNLSLPLKDGYELGEYLKNQEDFKQVPLILIKEAFEPLDKERLEAIEYVLLVQKPFDSDALARKVRTAIEERKIPMTLPEEPVWDEGSAAKMKVELDETVRELVKGEMLSMQRELEKRVKARILAELKMWLINNQKR